MLVTTLEWAALIATPSAIVHLGVFASLDDQELAGPARALLAKLARARALSVDDLLEEASADAPPRPTEHRAMLEDRLLTGTPWTLTGWTRSQRQNRAARALNDAEVVWQFSGGGQESFTARLVEDRLLDSAGHERDTAGFEAVRVAHPFGTPSAEVAAWRHLFRDKDSFGLLRAWPCNACIVDFRSPSM